MFNGFNMQILSEKNEEEVTTHPQTHTHTDFIDFLRNHVHHSQKLPLVLLYGVEIFMLYTYELLNLKKLLYRCIINRIYNQN